MKYKPRPAFIVLDEPCCLGCRQPIQAYHSDVCPLIVERSKVEAIERVAAALMRIGGALEAQLEVRADRVEPASRAAIDLIAEAERAR